MTGQGVSSLVADKHQITIAAGAKGECPFCRHPTFSIKKDDTVGKCFHPSCGRFITPWQFEAGPGSTFYKVLEEVYEDFHAELIKQQGTEGRHAYNYCVQERGIHPQVVADSMLGAVPSAYKLAARFKPVIEEAEAAASAEEKQPKGKGRPKKARGPTAHERLAFLKKAAGKLATCLSGHAGWLAFFYTDAAHRIVAIRFRKPYEKQIVYFKPTSVGGVFGHGLFTPYVSPELQPLNECLIVTEGEFNQLQLQSLCARIEERQGRPPESGYVNACAVGGVRNVDVRTIQRLARSPIVCYDHDASAAGFDLVQALLRAVTVTAFTTPRPDSDLDDFIRGFGLDVEGAHQAVKGLLAGRRLHVRPYDAVKHEIDELRLKEGGGEDGLKLFEVHRGAADVVIRDLKERGQLYQDGTNAYIFLDGEKRLVAVDREGPQFKMIMESYGIAPSENVFRFVLDALGLEALRTGTPTKVYSFSHYNRETFTLYVFNFEHQVYRIAPEKIDLVDNGTDGVLFVDNAKCKPVVLAPFDSEASPFNTIVVNPIRFQGDGLDVDERRMLFSLWFYALFFPELFPTRPILALVGEKGSGKSFTLRKVGQLLFGPRFNVMQLSEKPEDFDAAVTSTSFVALDNADSNVRWLPDRMAVIATGGTVMRRRLYTTNELAEYPVTASLAVTSRTPHFRREDVADRLLPFGLERFEQFRPESHFLAEIQEKRNAILADVVCHLQRIVRAQRNQAGKTYSTKFRMADFADFCLKLAHDQGWPDSMMSILERLSNEQCAFAVEGDVVFDLLELWLEQESNVGREIRSQDLHRELLALAEAKKITFRYTSPKAFGRRLRNLMSTLQPFFTIKERRGKADAWFLTFWPKEQGEREEAA